MEKDGVLIISDYKGFNSTKLMDQLHICNVNSEYKYNMLRLDNVFKIWKDNCCYKVDLYIKRHILGDVYITDHYNFTEISRSIFGKEFFEGKSNLALIKSVYSSLENVTRNRDIDEHFFDVPVLFRAKTSDEKYLIGETKLYSIVGARFKKFFEM